MLTSELIARLQEMRAQHGDLPVVYRDLEFNDYLQAIEEITYDPISDGTAFVLSFARA